MVPALFNKFQAEGFHATVCSDASWYANGPSGYWVTLFIYSKIPELLDTIFMVLRGKPVIFLHWFHHVTVLMYCWHAYHVMIGAGVWFAAMNYSVHSVMYFYFFCTNVGLYKVCVHTGYEEACNILGVKLTPAFFMCSACSWSHLLRCPSPFVRFFRW